MYLLVRFSMLQSLREYAERVMAPSAEAVTRQEAVTSKAIRKEDAEAGDASSCTDTMIEVSSDSADQGAVSNQGTASSNHDSDSEHEVAISTDAEMEHHELPLECPIPDDGLTLMTWPQLYAVSQGVEPSHFSAPAGRLRLLSCSRAFVCKVIFFMGGGLLQHTQPLRL